jgi:hypothetical protein
MIEEPSKLSRETHTCNIFCALTILIPSQYLTPSLFVSIRKRLGNESFDEMNQIIIKQALTLSQESRPAEDSRKNEEGAKITSIYSEV